MSADQEKALKFLIKSAPGGEIMDVLHHLGTLVGDLENNESVKKALKTWFE